MKKNIKFNHFLFFLLFISSSCKEVKSIFSNDHNTPKPLPTNREILKILHSKISKKDFKIKVLSKKIKSVSTINIEREKFFEDKKKKTSHTEYCQGIQLRLRQTTKRNCSLSLQQKEKDFPYTHCLKLIKTRHQTCKKWVKPLFFARYCKEGSSRKVKKELPFLNLPQGHSFKPLLRIEVCKLEGKKTYKLRQFKAIEEISLLHAQKM